MLSCLLFVLCACTLLCTAVFLFIRLQTAVLSSSELALAAMKAACALAALLVSIPARAGAFVASPSSYGALGDSCFCSASGSMNGRRSRAVSHSPQRCNREQQQQQEQEHCHHHQQARMSLFYSRRHQHTAQQRQRRRRCLAGSGHPPTGTETATATTMSLCSGSSSSEGDLEQQQPQPQQQQQQRGPQQTRADFLRAGASVAGFAAVVLGAQKQVKPTLLLQTNAVMRRYPNNLNLLLPLYSVL